MTTISIQVHLSANTRSIAILRSYLRRLFKIPNVKENKHLHFVNYKIKTRTNNIIKLWIRHEKPIKNIMNGAKFIACATGKHEWDDYILLHGYNGSRDNLRSLTSHYTGARHG